MANGFPIPQGLYSGGSVVFDSQPLANLYHQHTMRAQARDEALDDYFRNLNKSINPAGVRNQDIEGLTKKQQEWTQFYLQNKQAIKNPRADNGKAYAEYQSRLQDMHNYVQQSKNATSVSDDLAKARMNPNMSYVFDDDSIVGQIADHDKPLTDPTRKDINIQQLSIQPKPIEAKEWQAFQKSAMAGLKPSEEVEKIDIDPKTLDTVTTVKKKYSNEDLQAVGNRYKSLYQFDRRIRSSTDKNLLNAPNVAELNEVYKNVYGKNAETPADLLAAQGIMNAQSEGTFEKRTPGSLEQKKVLERMKQANRRELVGMQIENWKKKREITKAEESLWLTEHLDKMYEEAKSSPDKGKHRLSDGTVLEESQIPMDAISAKALARGAGSSYVEPDYIRITSDGKIRPVFYKYKDGKPVRTRDGWFEIDESLSQPISADAFKRNMSKYLQTAKQRAAEMSGDSGSGDSNTTVEDVKTKYNIKY